MKRSMLFLFAAAILASCAKSNRDPKPVPHPNAMTYKVHGVTDQEVSIHSSVVIPITVEHIDGDQEKLSLSVSDLPPGVTATITPANGIPDFNASITLKAGKEAVAGKRSIKINMTTPLGSNKSMDMALNVKDMPDPPVVQTGTYAGTYYNSTTFAYIHCTAICSETDTPGMVRLSFSSSIDTIIDKLYIHAMGGNDAIMNQYVPTYRPKYTIGGSCANGGLGALLMQLTIQVLSSGEWQEASMILTKQ